MLLGALADVHHARLCSDRHVLSRSDWCRVSTVAWTSHRKRWRQVLKIIPKHEFQKYCIFRAHCQREVELLKKKEIKKKEESNVKGI